jgi:hypothetical protein
MSDHKVNRPTLEAALAAWHKCLASRNLPAQTHWVFAENLCFEASPAAPDGFNLGFQTKFTAPADDALDIAFDQFSETDARMVFYRLGSSPRGSTCILLCDSWFENKNKADGFERHDEWGISFYPGQPGNIEEITDLSRWLRRVRRNRAFHDFDFAMSLATVDEIKIHGRALQPYERFADTMLNRMRRVLGNPA